MEDDIVPGLLPSVKKRRRSGNDKRREGFKLPQMFLVLDVSTNMIVGAMQVDTCVEVAHLPLVVFWDVSRSVQLKEPILEQSRTRRPNYIVTLTPVRVNFIRLSNASVGGTLNCHFLEFSSDRWRVWPVNFLQGHAVADWNIPFTMETPKAMRCHAHVESVEVTAVPDARARFHAELTEANHRGETADHMGETADHMSVVEQVRTTLLAFSNKTGGAVTRRYSVEGLLKYLSLHSLIRPGVQLQRCLAECVRLFFGDEGSELANDIIHGTVPVPSPSVLRCALLRIDLCDVIFQRSNSQKHVTFKYFLVDSSPQLGFNFRCVREDSISIPKAIYADPILRAGYDLNQGYSTRVLKLAVLGRGRASGVKKMKPLQISCSWKATASIILTKAELASWVAQLTKAPKGKWQTAVCISSSITTGLSHLLTPDRGCIQLASLSLAICTYCTTAWKRLASYLRYQIGSSGVCKRYVTF